MLTHEMQVQRNSKLGCLVVLRDLGFHPEVVIDIGAQTGTDALYQAFPEAKHLMVEPVSENKEVLQQIASQLRDAEVIIAAAASRSGEAFLHISPNTRYSRISDSAEPGPERRDVREIACISIDDMCRERALNGPFLLKVDVDGKELDVLKGGIETLEKTACAVVETVFFGNGQIISVAWLIS